MVQITITIQDTGHLDQDAELLLCLVGQYCGKCGQAIDWSDREANMDEEVKHER